MRGLMNARGDIRARRLRGATLACGLAFLVLGSGIGAAQEFDDPDGAMPPRAVVWRLADRGFTAVSRPRFDGRTYVVDADDPYGERVRVFVDAYDGAILRRQRVGPPLIAAPIGAPRSAPGYGWTEEDAAPRRPIREAERILPPVDRNAPALRRTLPDVAPSARPGTPDRNPMGLNPDAKNPDPKIRPEAPVKTARLPGTPKPSLPRASAPAPKLSETPPAPSASEASPAIGDTPKPVTPATNVTASTPAATPSSTTKAAKDWKDPPAEGKKPVRVIGGATMVPGATETAKD
ncbi:hypothetical protein SAMN05192565_101234 [Methylobacterium gossipiicola]|uniref:PepSY domain-containing protein n=2 Tax=Methylobacterium gossipiicola TaxID=582675 RepID=A0A1I2QSS9_9HYPH|nr:hypothetical protein SAMN05192565_101234 [Methylobacterium gossipiicola]